MQPQYTPPEGGLCLCGCGQRTPIAKKTNSAKGHIAGVPTPFCLGHRPYKGNEPYHVDPVSGCWVWNRGRSEGYGTMERNRVSWKAYRWYWEQKNGLVPPGLELDHKCRNRACVNPDHLEPVTRAVNVQRGNLAKLTPDQVREIRTLQGTQPSKVIAARYGISVSALEHIWQRYSTPK